MHAQVTVTEEKFWCENWDLPCTQVHYISQLETGYKTLKLHGCFNWKCPI